MSPRTSLAAAAEEVARADPVLARVIERAGPMKLPKSRQPEPFLSLSEAIVYQQLAGRAAAAIWGRIVAQFPGGMTAEAVAAADESLLRGAGLSLRKAQSIKDLATRALDGTIPLDRLRRLSDEEIARRLTVVKGVGQWTADMFLIFELHRLDVWPVLDFGVRKGWAIVHDLADLPAPKALDAEGERFRPYRTVAAWYCWRAVSLARAREMALPALPT